MEDDNTNLGHQRFPFPNEAHSPSWSQLYSYKSKEVAAFCPDFSVSLHHTRIIKQYHKTAATNAVVNSLQKDELYKIALRLPTTIGGLLKILSLS